MQLSLNRLFFTPKQTVNQFGETVPPFACIDSALVRRSQTGDFLEICMEGRFLVGCANGPHVTIDSTPAPCIFFENETLVAAIPSGTGPRARVLVTYGPLVSGDFLVRNTPGARVRRWAIRIDDRLRHPGHRGSR